MVTFTFEGRVTIAAWVEVTLGYGAMVWVKGEGLVSGLVLSYGLGFVPNTEARYRLVLDILCLSGNMFTATLRSGVLTYTIPNCSFVGKYSDAQTQPGTNAMPWFALHNSTARSTSHVL